MSNLKNLVGEKFGSLSVIKRVPSLSSKYSLWLCHCDCGKDVVVRGGNLASGNSKSCGCKKMDIGRRSLKHGMSNTRLYHIHSWMKERCSKPYSSAYRWYGGKGVCVCDEWLGENGFKNFADWAMASGYSDELSIDRINPNGNYEPTNCRWVDTKTQQNNKTSNRHVEYQGSTYTLTQFSEMIDMKIATVWARLKRGWSVEKVANTPVKPWRK